MKGTEAATASDGKLLFGVRSPSTPLRINTLGSGEQTPSGANLPYSVDSSGFQILEEPGGSITWQLHGDGEQPNHLLTIPGQSLRFCAAVESLVDMRPRMQPGRTAPAELSLGEGVEARITTTAANEQQIFVFTPRGMGLIMARSVTLEAC